MSPTGLRERKKLKTKEAIQREAMRMFQEQGYDETTIEQIAAAAEISPSTFFNYFPTKEDVVLFDRYDPMLVATMAARPPGESLSAGIRAAMEGLGALLERDQDIVLARAKLALEAPALRARFWEEMEKARDLLVGIMVARTGRDPNDFELKVVAMVLVTATFEACLEWMRRDGRGNLVELVNQALELVHIGARLDALDRPLPKRS
jgi:AcrR family transcriptional regulator